MGGGQDKPAWTACPPGVKITRAGDKISRDSLPPGGQDNRGWLAPRGASCPGGKINWDTGVHVSCTDAKTQTDETCIAELKSATSNAGSKPTLAPPLSRMAQI